jgi:hypothetical protein
MDSGPAQGLQGWQALMLLVVSWHKWNVCETANETSSAQCDAPCGELAQVECV